MKISLIVGCEGILGSEIVAAKLASQDVYVVGFDQKNKSKIENRNFSYICGSIQNTKDLEMLKQKIIEIQVKNKIEKCLDSIVNVFAAQDYKFDAELVPTDLPESEWMMWGWLNYPSQDFLRQYEINVVGIHKILTTLYECYKESKSCSIVNFSSQFAHRNLNQEIFTHLGRFTFKPPAYAASKSAIENYTQYLSQLFQGTGIRVNALAPGIVNTGQNHEFTQRYAQQTITGRLMEPQEIIGAIEFLTSESSSYMTGACLTLDGGWSIR